MVQALNLQNIFSIDDIFKQNEREKRTDYSSEEESSLVKILPQIVIKEEGQSPKGMKILRTFYAQNIIEVLNWLAKCHVSPHDSLPYINKLLCNLSEYREQHFEDPFSSFLSALYDGLVANDAWIDLSKEKYKKIGEMIKSLNNKKELSYNKIDKAINELDKMGIDTLPY